MATYANYNPETGEILGFYDSELHGENIPEPYVELTATQWQTALSGNYRVTATASAGGSAPVVELAEYEPTPEELAAAETRSRKREIEAELEQIDADSVPYLRAVALNTKHEAWTFTLDDGSELEKDAILRQGDADEAALEALEELDTRSSALKEELDALKETQETEGGGDNADV